MATGLGSPCGACKFLRRKCTPDCIFAPYFSSDESPAQFAAIHKVFGASNVSKLLSQLPTHDRCEAVVTVAYEAQARLKDPVYGCVGHIFALQKQVAILQAQLMQVKAQLAYQAALSLVLDQDQTQGSSALLQSYNLDMQQMCNPKRSSADRVEYCQSGGGLLFQQMGCYREELASTQELFKKRAAPQHDFGELQAMAQRIMRS